MFNSGLFASSCDDESPFVACWFRFFRADVEGGERGITGSDRSSINKIVVSAVKNSATGQKVSHNYPGHVIFAAYGCE